MITPTTGLTPELKQVRLNIMDVMVRVFLLWPGPEIAITAVELAGLLRYTFERDFDLNEISEVLALLPLTPEGYVFQKKDFLTQ